MLTINDIYGGLDADTDMFLSHFREPKGSRVLEIGANEEYAANILTDNGYDTVGIDLRPLQTVFCNYYRIEGDFCELAETLGTFDSVFSLSAIEHFGLMTYGDQQNDLPYYDVVTAHLMWKILKPSGTCYITVPYGKDHLTYGIHWRVYNRQSLQERIIQKFKVEEKVFFTSAAAMIDGTIHREPKRQVTEEEADKFNGDPHPHVTVLLKMRK